MKILGIIPARYASTRFPGKALIDIKGKTMVHRVYEQCKKSLSLDDVIIATDHQYIVDEATKINAPVVLTKEDHESGTDRCWEAYQNYGKEFDFIINIQGDEPFISPKQIDLLCSVIDAEAELATLIKRFNTIEEIKDPKTAKVVLNIHGEALYFSRSVMPFMKEGEEERLFNEHTYYDHLGLYVYRTDILEKITKLPVSSLEKIESLEQLRWLENGFKIKTALSDIGSWCIDTPADLEIALEKFDSLIEEI